MPRRTLALVATVVCAAALAPDARAGVTYGFAFRATDALGAPIPGGTAAGGTFTFDNLAAAQACQPLSGAGCPVLDVLMRVGQPIIASGTSIGFDPTGGLAASSASAWGGYVITPGLNPDVFGPYFFSEITSSRVSLFGGESEIFDLVPLPPGTYNVGTVVWDTSASAPGSHAVGALVGTGLEGTGVNVGPDGSLLLRNIVDITGTEVLESGAIVIAGAPAVPALSAAALGVLAVALLLVARRRR